MTSRKGPNGGHSCNLKKNFFWSSTAGSLGKRMEEKKNRGSGGGTGMVLICFLKAEDFQVH